LEIIETEPKVETSFSADGKVKGTDVTDMELTGLFPGPMIVVVEYYTVKDR
jgi:hypothetical protein